MSQDFQLRSFSSIFRLVFLIRAAHSNACAPANHAKSYEYAGPPEQGGYGLMNIGTHLVNNMLEIAGHVRRVTAAATAGGRAITPHDVLPAPSGMGVIVGENITATLSFGAIRP